MKRLTKLIVIITCVFFVSQSGLAMDDNARNLFFNPESMIATKALIGNSSSNTVVSPDTAPGVDLSTENIGGLGGIGGYYEKLENQGISVWIELLRKGSTSAKRVEPSRVFKSGDKIRIHMVTNGDGYLHALHRGTSGVEKIIPISSGGRVNTGVAAVIPSNGGWLKFDKNVGIEKIDLLFGSHSQAAESSLVPVSTSTPESLTVNVRDVIDNYRASKNLITFEQQGTKDLVVVDQSGGGNNSIRPIPISRQPANLAQVAQDILSAPAQYAVNTANEPVVMQLNLKHQ